MECGEALVMPRQRGLCPDKYRMKAMSRRLFVLMLAAVGAAGQAPHRHLMMVVSKGLPGITIYDADTEQVMCRAKTEVSPHEAAFSLDGRMAYVPVYGSTGVGRAGTDQHVLHFFKTSDCSDAGSVDTGEYKRPHGIAVGRSGMIYLTSEVAKSLLLVDPKTRKIVGTIPTDSQYSHMIAVTPDEKTVYVSNVQSKTVSILDISDRKLAREVRTGAENQRMTLSPDLKWFVTSLGPEHKIAFYRTSDDQLDFTIPVDDSPFVAKFSADGKYLYDANVGNGGMRAWKIDIAGRKAVASNADSLGKATGSLVVNPFNHEVYLSSQASNEIDEIDPATWTVKKRLPTDQTPDEMVFTAVR